MNATFQLILDWSEVWAPIIPLVTYSIFKPKVAYLKPVFTYLYLAFAISLIGNIIGYYGRELGLPLCLQRNTFLYNAHSIVRLACFCFFFIQLQQPFLTKWKKIIPFLFAAFVVINFAFFEQFNSDKHLSGRLLSTEAFLLLLYCLQYYFYYLREEQVTQRHEAHFWVTTGLSVFVVINFFIFLFYVSMVEEDPELAERMWNYHNYAYIIFCLFLTKAFYGAPRH